MSNEKRLLLALLLTFVWLMGLPYVLEVTGLAPPPAKKPQPAPAAKVADAKAELPPPAAKPAEGEAAKGEAGSTEPAPAKATRIEHVDPGALVIGSTRNTGPKGYLLEVRLTQKGAGVESVASSQYEAEFEGKNPHKPLQLLKYDPKAPPSLALSLVSIGDAPAAADVPKAEIPLGEMDWEVVRDDKGRLVRPVPADAKSEAEEQGQEVVFRATTGEPPLVLTKTYRLRKGASAFELELGFESPSKDRAVVYKLLGPHGIPIEGEWYTGTFRDAFFGQVDGSKVKVVTKAAYDIAKGKDTPERFQSLPLKYAGVENQYFASFVEPQQAPLTTENRWDAEAVASVLHEDPDARQKADIGIEITSKPVAVGPNGPATHSYWVFAGPKTADALRPYGATALSSYRKSGWFGIPFAPEVASVISPLLDNIYQLTKKVAGLFGGSRGNYGVAIILLTLLVRMMMFPLGRKQAIAAKKMQDLQPYMKEIQEKYKDDREQLAKEQLALYKRHGVNPVGGCLPALIQLPIFVGLWQALNTSVHLRHASFLWIQNLAAPDMLFRFPWELPFLGQYFNLLPFLVVALMLVQTKLFSPPPTTPEAEMQQKMMKYMMVFMAFMFYKVPSGLGIYFITSSLWQISERLLLPKVTSKPALALGEDGDVGPQKGGGGGGKGGPGGGGNGAPPKPPGKWSQFLEKVLDEAKKDPTYRKVMGEPEEPDKGKDRDRDRGRPRARPGRRR
jgi:YidC/Oxa1 family membrane protein insertase